MYLCCFFFQAEDGIRDLVRSRGLGDVYKRQALHLREVRDAQPACLPLLPLAPGNPARRRDCHQRHAAGSRAHRRPCLLYTSDAADERSSVDLGGRRIIKKKKNNKHSSGGMTYKHIK